MPSARPASLRSAHQSRAVVHLQKNSSYRQETKSIQEFICYTDEYLADIGDSDLKVHSDILHENEPSSGFRGTLDRKPSLSNSKWLGPAKNIFISFHRRYADENFAKPKTHPRITVYPSLPRSREKLSEENREERRKDQNREHQRCYREKRMRLDLLRKAALAPSSTNFNSRSLLARFW